MMEKYKIYFKRQDLNWNKIGDLTPDSSDSEIIAKFERYYSIKNYKAVANIDGDYIIIEISQMPRLPSEEFDNITALASEGDYNKVREKLDKLLEQYPLESELYRLYGQSYYQEGEDDKAEIRLLKSLSYDPENLWALLLYGNIYYKNGKLDNAYNIYKRAYDIDPDDKYLLISYGSVCLSLGYFDEAKKIANHLLEVDQNNAYAHTILDRVEEAKGEQ